MIEILFKQLTIFAIIMFIGLVATKLNLLTEDMSKGLNKVILNIANPALILSSYNVKATDDIVKNLLLTFIVSSLIFIVIILLSLIFTKGYVGDRKKIMRFSSVIGNSGFMGFPLVAAVFGKTGLLYASIFAISNNIVTWTYGEMVMSGVKPSNKIILVKKLFTNPSLLAVVIGLPILLSGISFPYVLTEPFNLLGSLTGPLSMLILGEKMSKINFKHALVEKDLYYGIFLRLIMMPLVSLFILKFFKTPQEILSVVFTVFSMPTAIVTVLLSERYNRDVEFASQLTVVSHAFCILTVPLLFRLL